MIQIQSLSMTYPGAAHPALAPLDLEIRPGEVFGFLGPNGAGKTTTLKMITGILQPTQGDALYDGLSITQAGLSAKKRFGFVPDTPEVSLRMRAGEYLNFLADVYGVNAELRRQRIETLARLWEITEHLGQPLGSFSHGMKQKILLIGSLIHDPDHWILDEPQVGLDPQAAFHLKDLMRERARAGKSVLFSTHILEVAEKICDRVGILSRGNLVFCGTLDELVKKAGQASLEDLFLRLTQGKDQ